MADFSALQAATDMDPMVIGDQFDLQSVNAVEVIPEPEPIQPRMPGSIAGIRQSLDMPGEPEALMPGSVRARIDDLKLRLGMNVESAVQPRLPGSIEAQRNLFQYNMAEMMAQQTAESAVEMVEEPEGPPQGFLEQTIAGVRDIPEALLASGNDLVSLLVHVPAIVDAAVTGEYEGMFANWSRASFERSARIRSGMSPRDPNLSWMERVLNMQTLIPTVADFGLQIVASGGLGAAAKIAGTEAALKMGATAAGARFAGRAAAITAASTHAGVSEAVHTFDEMQRRGYTVGESLSAFSKHAVASGMLNAPTFAFLLGKLPSFTQQRMLAKMLEGGTTEAVTETLDEVAGHAAMGDFDVKSWAGIKEAAGYFWDVFPEVGPAAFLIGGGVGAIGKPPVKPSPVSAGELEARENIDYSTIEGTGIDSEVLPSYVAKVMEREATYAKLRSGEKIPLIDADNDRGGLVRYEFGWYLIPPGHKNGTAEPIPFNQIVEVGKHEIVNGVGSEVVLVGSEVMENVQKKGEEFRELLYGKDLVEVPKSKSRAEARKLLLDQMLKDRTELKTEGALLETEEEIAKKRLGKLEENKGYVWPGLFGGKMKPTAVVRERLEHYRQVLGDLEVIREQVRAIESDPGLKEALSAEAGLGILGAEKQAAEAQLEGLKARQAELEQMAFEAEDEMEVDAELAKEVMMEMAGVEKRLDEITAAEEKLGSGFIYDENGIQFESVERFFTVQPEVGQNVVDGAFGENNQADVILSAMTQGNEDVRRDLIDGVIAVDDVVQGQFEAQGLLKFVEVDGKYRISRVEGQSDLEYQGALDEYVRSVRRLHTALYYSSEVVEERQKKIEQVAEKYPIRDGETMEEYIGRVGPRTGGPLFSKGEGEAESSTNDPRQVEARKILLELQTLRMQYAGSQNGFGVEAEIDAALSSMLLHGRSTLNSPQEDLEYYKLILRKVNSYLERAKDPKDVAYVDPTKVKPYEQARQEALALPMQYDKVKLFVHDADTRGRALNSTAKTAEFLGWQERPGGKPPIALYNIPTEDGGKTTVTAETARARGFIVPEPPQRGEVLESKAKGVKNQKTAAAFYVAALNHTTLYPTLLNAAVVAGHQDPFTSAKLGSEIAISMARAWVQGGKGRSVQEFFDTYAREVRAFGEKVREGELDRVYTGFGVSPRKGLFSKQNKLFNKAADAFNARIANWAEKTFGPVPLTSQVIFDIESYANEKFSDTEALPKSEDEVDSIASVAFQLWKIETNPTLRSKYELYIHNDKAVPLLMNKIFPDATALTEHIMPYVSMGVKTVTSANSPNLGEYINKFYEVVRDVANEVYYSNAYLEAKPSYMQEELRKSRDSLLGVTTLSQDDAVSRLTHASEVLKYFVLSEFVELGPMSAPSSVRAMYTLGKSEVGGSTLESGNYTGIGLHQQSLNTKQHIDNARALDKISSGDAWKNHFNNPYFVDWFHTRKHNPRLPYSIDVRMTDPTADVSEPGPIRVWFRSTTQNDETVHATSGRVAPFYHFGGVQSALDITKYHRNSDPYGRKTQVLMTNIANAFYAQRNFGDPENFTDNLANRPVALIKKLAEVYKTRPSAFKKLLPGQVQYYVDEAQYRVQTLGESHTSPLLQQLAAEMLISMGYDGIAYDNFAEGRRDKDSFQYKRQTSTEPLSIAAVIPNSVKAYYRSEYTADGERRTFATDNIYYSKTGEDFILGMYSKLDQGLDFFGGSDLPTFLHEFAHAWRQSMSGKELEALAKWAHGKKKPPADGSWTVEAEEKFADTFVSWASNPRSKAPVGLENAFKEIAQYTTELYKTHSYLNPGKKVSPQFAEHMEALYTKRLLLSANADDQEEGRRRTKTKREFTNPNPRRDLGDHIEEMGKILGMNKESITGVIDAEAEAARRLKTKSYEIELNNKLKAMEKGELPVVDLADIIILRDRALKIRVEFEQNFRKAYDKGPQAVKRMVEGMKKRNNMVQLENFLKVRGDAGRRLNLFSNRMSQVDFALTLDEAQFRMGSKALDVLYQMMKDPERAMEIADKHGGEVNVRLKDLYFQAFFSGLLSSPQTLAVNTIFTGLWSLNNFFVLRPLAGAIEKTMWSARNITGVGKVIDKFFYGGDIRKRDEYVAPLADAFSGLGRAVKYAGRDAFEIVKSGGEVHKMEQIKGMDIHARDITAWQNYTVTESGLIGRTVRRLFGEAGGRNARLKIQGAIHDTGVLLALPTTMMRSSDMFFKVLAAEEALARLVSAEARRIHPSNRRAQKDYFNTQMSNYRDLDNLPPNMKKQWMQEMQQIASYDTFMDLPGQVTRHLLAIREAQPVAKLVIPFLNTIVNLGKRGLELTPGIGLLAEWSYTMDPQFKRDTFGHRPSDILAKQVEGMLLVAMLFLGLDDDDLIGAPPSDPKRAQLMLEQGKIPYSIRIGDRYISFQNAAPFNVPMSIIADLRQYVLSNVDDFDNPDPEVQKKVNQDLMQAAWAFASFGLNNGFMQNYGEYVRARTIENKSAVLGRTVESALVPYSGFLRWIQRSANASQNPEGYFMPNRKDTLTQNAFPLTHNVINKMFGMPETDIPRLTVWGEPYHFSENKWWELWWPVHYQSASNDPLDAEVARLGYYPGMPHETYEVNGKRYRFSPDIHQQYVLGAGQDSKEAARRVVNSKYWNDVSDERKVKLLSDAVSRARERHHRRAKAEQYKRGLIPVSRGILTQ